MASFAVSYSERDDSLSAWFGGLDDGAWRVYLSDNIEVTFTRDGRTPRSIHMQEFSRLLLVSETELTGLQELNEDEAATVRAHLAEWPLSLFVRVNDPELLTARVEAPHLRALVDEPEA